MVLGIYAQVVVNGPVPELLHESPILNDPVLHGIDDGMSLRVLVCVIANIKVEFLVGLLTDFESRLGRHVGYGGRDVEGRDKIAGKAHLCIACAVVDNHRKLATLHLYLIMLPKFDLQDDRSVQARSSPLPQHQELLQIYEKWTANRPPLHKPNMALSQVRTNPQSREGSQTMERSISRVTDLFKRKLKDQIIRDRQQPQSSLSKYRKKNIKRQGSMQVVFSAHQSLDDELRRIESRESQLDQEISQFNKSISLRLKETFIRYSLKMLDFVPAANDISLQLEISNLSQELAQKDFRLKEIQSRLSLHPLTGLLYDDFGRLKEGLKQQTKALDAQWTENNKFSRAKQRGYSIKSIPQPKAVQSRGQRTVQEELRDLLLD